MKLTPRMAALALPLLLAGCVVAPVGPYADADVVMAAPPPYVEVVPVAPAVGWIWIGGNWTWHGGRHHWNRGHWAPPSRPGYHWVPPRGERHGRGWRDSPRYWQRR